MAADAGVDAVQLLTVHGAKGLEADAVLLVDTDAQAPRAATATLLIDWPPHSEGPRRVAFVASEARCPPSLRELLANEQAQREREELNALYVALTRARERLWVSASEPQHVAARSWWARLHALATPLDPVPTPAAVAPACSVSLSLLPALRLAPADAAADDPVSPADDSAARLGRAVHLLLQWCGGAVEAVAVDAAAPAAVAAVGLPPAWAGQAAESVRAVLASAQTAPFFAGDLRWAGNEVSLADEAGVLRIDRLVCRQRDGRPEWWVLDYKLASAPQHESALRAQLARYRAAVERLRPGEPVRAAFVTGRGELVEV